MTSIRLDEMIAMALLPAKSVEFTPGRVIARDCALHRFFIFVRRFVQIEPLLCSFSNSSVEQMTQIKDWKAPSRMACMVVIVDDSDVLLDNYVDVVRQAGIEVIGCTTIKDAQAHIRMCTPAVVVVDLSMDYRPDAGHDLCVWIRRVAPSASVLVHTSSESKSDHDLAITNGVVDYLVKTSDLGPLLDRIKTLCAAKNNASRLNVMRSHDSLRNHHD